MQAKRLTGPNASALKYDVLTALALSGLQLGPPMAVSMQRLSLVITARYNWRTEELSLGQRDMARMWNVTERTAKREVKRLTDSGILICSRAGVRGRVAAYRLNLKYLFELSEPFWPAVGPDYADRMAASNPVQSSDVVKVNFGATPPDTVSNSPEWAAVAKRIEQLHPQIYASWIAPLRFLGDDGYILRLKGPSPFACRYVETHHMRELMEAVEACIGPQRRIVISAD